MPAPIIILTAVALGLRLLLGGYGVVKPSLFVATVSAMAICLFLYCLKSETRKQFGVQMLTIAVAMPLLAWAMPSIGLLLTLMCFWVPIAAGRFQLIAPTYLFSLLLLPGLDDILFIGSLKLIDFGVLDALALGAAVAIWLSQSKGKCRPEWDAAALSLVILISVASARDTSLSHQLRALVELSFDLALPYYIISRGIRTGQELRDAMLWLAVGGFVVGAMLVFEVWRAWPVYIELYRHYQLPTVILVKLRAGFIRAGGPFVEPTSVAMVLAICAFALYLSRDYMRTRWHYMLVMTAMVIGLIAPQSRGAWIGLAIAIVIADMLRGRHTQLMQKIFVLGSLASCLFLAAQFLPYLSETLGLSGGASESSEYRRRLFARGLEEFTARPLQGYSMPELAQRLHDMVQGEGIIDFVNAYIWIMLIAGIFGLALFTGIFLFFLRGVYRVGRFKGGGNRNAEAGVFVFATLLMLMEMLFFTSFGTRPAYFVFALFGFAAAYIRVQSATTHIAPVEEPLLAVGVQRPVRVSGPS